MYGIQYIYIVLGCFFFVGAALPGESKPHHKSVFDFDEVSITLCTIMYNIICHII